MTSVRRSLGRSLAVFTVLVVLPGMASAAPRYDDILPLAQVRPGMKGYGLTVFHGTRIERFDVTVVAVVRNGSLVAPGHDMILVRMSGGPMTQRAANLVKGMSGSPVYINGKCIGAFSQGEPSSKEPLGGVTPIEDMLEAWDPKLPEKPMEACLPTSSLRGVRQGPTGMTLATPIHAGQRIIRRIAFDVESRASTQSPSTLCLQPCSSFVTVSGMPARFRERLAELLKPYGVEVLQSMAGGRQVQFSGASLRPGAAFSVMLLSGDITSGATGTITYRRGDRFLAFGHPFMGLGPLPAPACAAYVHDVYPLNSGSYKITTPGPALGAVLQDRPFGVSGRAGKAPETIPITVDVNDATTGRSKVYGMRAVPHPRLYAALVGLAVGSAVADIHSTPGPVTATVETIIEAQQLGTLRRSNVVYDGSLIDTAVAGDLDEILTALSSNPFQPLGISSASVKVRLEAGRKTATIEQVSVGSAKYRPGDTVDITLTLKPYGAPPVTKSLGIRIPDHCPAGRLTLTVQGGAPPAALSLGGFVIRPSQPTQPEKAPPANVRQIVARVLEQEAGNEIAAVLSLPSTSVAIDGEPLRGLPPTLDAALRSSRISSIKTDRDEVRAVMPTEWVVSGRQTVTIVIEKLISRPSASGTSGTQPSAATIPAPPATTQSNVFFSAGMPAESRQNPPRMGSAGNILDAGSSKGQPAQGGVASATVSQPVAQADSAKTSASVAKMARVWRHSTEKDWASAEMDGVAAGSGGAVQLVPTLQVVCRLPEAVVWCITSDGHDGIYAGTGTSGRVYHVTSAGKYDLVASLPEVSVHSLARLADGTLLAGTGPRGRTYRIAADGAFTVVHTAQEPYVLALAVGKDGSVFIGTGGGKGSIYRLDARGRAEPIATAVDEHVLCLCCSDDVLYAGTAGRGMVLRREDNGPLVTVMDVPGLSVTAMAAEADGAVIAVTSPRGTVWRVRGDSCTCALDPTPAGLQAAARLPQGGVVAAGGAYALRVDEQGIGIPYDVPPTSEILAAAVGSDGRVWMGTANAAEILSSTSEGPRKGSLASPVLDAGATARWGRLACSATVPDGSACTIETRSGNTLEAGPAWSRWSAIQLEGGGGRVVSPPARYLQYRVLLTASASGKSPIVRDIAISYLPQNRRPTVSLQTPAGGEQWSGVQTLRWQASDPDQDTLAYVVECSGDGGKSWEPLPTARMQKTEEVQKPALSNDGRPATQRRLVSVSEVTAELDRHPDLPQALRQAIIERTQKLNAETGSAIAVPNTTPVAIRETSRQLDTRALRDGTYLFRVTASDGPSNWTDIQKAEAVSKDVIICNSPPVVFLLQATKAVSQDRCLSIECVAVQSTATVTAAQWRVDDGDWNAAAPADGLADSHLERFLINTLPLVTGKHKLEVRVYNSAGLYAAETTEFTVP